MRRKPVIAIWLVRLTAVAAIVLSAFLTWASLSGSSVPGCGIEGLDCGKVLSTRWSKSLGVPVSAGGLAVYAGVFVFSWFIGRNRGAAIEQIGWYGLIVLSLLAFMAAIWFTSLQFADDNFCLYCLITHVCGTMIVALVFWSVPWQSAGPRAPSFAANRIFGSGAPTPLIMPNQPRGVGLSQITVLAGLAGCAMFVLIAGQLFSPHQTMVVEEMASANNSDAVLDQSPSETPASAATKKKAFSSIRPPTDTERDGDGVANSGEVETDEKVTRPSGVDIDFAKTTALKPVVDAERLVEFFPTASAIDVYQRPVVGDRQATHLILKLMDYTCKHCRKMHHHLEAVLRRYGDQIAVVMVPIALNTDCNKHVKKNHDDHAEACRYVKLALAVWQADDEKFSIYHEYLMTDEKIPPLRDAVEFAKDLVGDKALRREVKSPVVKDMMQENHDLMNSHAKKGLPTLIVGKSRFNGLPSSDEELFDQLEKLLPIQPIEVALTRE